MYTTKRKNASSLQQQQATPSLLAQQRRTAGLLTLGLISGLLGLGVAGTALAETGTEPSAFEQDRQAILAMAGSYEVGFHFNETYAVRPGYTLHEPYHSGASEMVTVVADEGNKIVLQHVLVACESKQEKVEGEAFRTKTVSECRPVKHWRQDWVYEDRELMRFKGNDTWTWETISKDQARGQWSQAVYQVDDGPRYEAVGRWHHEHNQSMWESEPTWRPLPRREYTKRDDYDVLVAINRHVITPDGWIHEQDNYKLDLHRNTEHPVIARERGFNQYERNNHIDLSLAEDYWAETADYWAAVRNAWQRYFDDHKSFQMLAKLDDKPRYKQFFNLALENDTPVNQRAGKVDAILGEYGLQP
ncbi:MAG: hypothetical protein MI750_00475 [Xanthomonadales bacterium]|nr:hypothetical protein [Xanthomonadales bacterium]